MSTVLIWVSFSGKKYGQSFKDYLNNYRMEQAADALLRTDKKDRSDRRRCGLP